MNTNASNQYLFQFWADALRPIVLIQTSRQQFLLSGVDALFAFEHFRHRPALFAVKTKQQCGRVAAFLGALHHLLDLLG